VVRTAQLYILDGMEVVKNMIGIVILM